MPHRGRVEIFYNGIWTAVCNSLDSITAGIACRQLGFPNASFSFQGGSYETYDEIEHVVETVICKEDTSRRLQYCSHPQLKTSCWAATQAWLQCEPGNLRETLTKL